MDILLALIPLTLLLGMVAANTGDALNLIEDSVYRSSTDRVGADTLNTLLETSGDPVNWETKGTPKVAGLAKYDDIKLMPIEGTISLSKLAALKESDVQNMVGTDYKFYLNITSEDRSKSIRSIGTYNSSAPDIVKMERVAFISKLDTVSKIENARANIEYAGPPYPFKTNNYYVSIYDYYALVVNHGFTNGSVWINGKTPADREVVKGTDFPGQTYIVKKIPDSILWGNSINASLYTTNLTDNLVTVRPGNNSASSLDLYIIQVPKGTNQTEITLDNMKPIGCRVDFYIWTVK